MYKYPDETWDREGLSWNKGITIDLIRKIVLSYATSHWDWYYISESISITNVYRYPDEPWDREGLSLNKDLAIGDIYRLDNRPRYDYRRCMISFSDIVIV